MRQGTRMQPHARGAMRDAPMAADHSRFCLGMTIWSISVWAETDWQLGDEDDEYIRSRLTA